MNATETILNRIPDFDSQIEHENIVSPASLVRGYRDSREKGRSLLVLDDWSLFPTDVPAIARSMQGHGIRQIALIDGSSALRDILWAFHEAGATFEMAEIDTGRTEDRFTQRFVPGFIITLG